MCHAGKEREHSSLLPERGGISSMRRGDLPLATSLENCSKRRQMSSWTHPARYLGLIRCTKGRNRLRDRRREANSISAFDINDVLY